MIIIDAVTNKRRRQSEDPRIAEMGITGEIDHRLDCRRCGRLPKYDACGVTLADQQAVYLICSFAAS
jgi:hypothetical protein